MRDKNAKLFTGLFGKLKMLEEINENWCW
jgi:hypothetical protein